MPTPDTWVQRLTQWRDEHALPLWSAAGLDSATQTAWESLNHDGTPRQGINRRTRVQFRQAFVFARQQDQALKDLGWALFRNVMAYGFDPASGRLSAWVDPNLNRLDQTHDLYDLSFALLAAAALGKAGFDVAADIAQLERCLDLLKAPIGWHETIGHRLPRRQNPHMHLFEASLSLYQLTSNPLHRSWAQACLDLMGDHLVTDTGVLLEYFHDDWAPYTGPAQVIEPGHMAEWIYLADFYDKTLGVSSGLPTDAFWDAINGYRLPSGFLPDRVGDTSRRLWPQTELLKAALVRGETVTNTAPLAHALIDDYLSQPVMGGWFDKFDEGGSLLSSDMPASTFYHLELMISAGIDAVSG